MLGSFRFQHQHQKRKYKTDLCVESQNRKERTTTTTNKNQPNNKTQVIRVTGHQGCLLTRGLGRFQFGKVSVWPPTDEETEAWMGRQWHLYHSWQSLGPAGALSKSHENSKCMSLSLSQVHRLRGSIRERAKAEAADLSGWLRNINVSTSPFAKWRRVPCEGHEG